MGSLSRNACAARAVPRSKADSDFREEGMRFPSCRFLTPNSPGMQREATPIRGREIDMDIHSNQNHDGVESNVAGFSLLEALIVCSIVGIVGMIAFTRMSTLSRVDEARSSATQIAGVLKNARAQAITSAVPQLVYVNVPESDGAGNCQPVATVVTDNDRNYAISDGDGISEISLRPSACDHVKLYAQDDTAKPFEATMTLPTEDNTARAPSSKTTKGKSKGKGGKSKGKGVTEVLGEVTEGLGLTGPRETVLDTVVNGSTFPTDGFSGLPVIAFSERGIAVDPADSATWGSGAGGIYVTDGERAVYAAIVEPLGSVQIRRYDAAANEWR
jgi:type II secretory pathway pseudopilin PulG